MSSPKSPKNKTSKAARRLRGAIDLSALIDSEGKYKGMEDVTNTIGPETTEDTISIVQKKHNRTSKRRPSMGELPSISAAREAKAFEASKALAPLFGIKEHDSKGREPGSKSKGKEPGSRSKTREPGSKDRNSSILPPLLPPLTARGQAPPPLPPIFGRGGTRKYKKNRSHKNKKSKKTHKKI